uniref:Uncharacterized protein n=1 Tax=Cannabis sativa TaxID=3483 RepID=A0A803QGN0_CANSA
MHTHARMVVSMLTDAHTSTHACEPLSHSPPQQHCTRTRAHICMRAPIVPSYSLASLHVHTHSRSHSSELPSHCLPASHASLSHGRYHGSYRCSATARIDGSPRLERMVHHGSLGCSTTCLKAPRLTQMFSANRNAPWLVQQLMGSHNISWAHTISHGLAKWLMGLHTELSQLSSLSILGITLLIYVRIG